MGIGRCWNCKKFEEHFYWDHLEETSLRFMKVMEGKFSHEMEFPKKFIRNFRVDLPDLITLKTSNGELWKISLFKDEDHFYLKDGWKEFIDALGIKEGYSLFFKYAGNSSFTVKIFDQTGYFRDASSFARHNKNKACKTYQTRQYRADEAASNSKRSQSSTVEMCSSRPTYDDYKLVHEISGSLQMEAFLIKWLPVRENLEKDQKWINRCKQKQKAMDRELQIQKHLFWVRWEIIV